MPNVNDDDLETLQFADESDYLDAEDQDDEPNPSDPPSTGADMLDRIISDATEAGEMTYSVRFGQVGDTNPAGIGEGAVHVLDATVGAEFLIVAVPWKTATEIETGTLSEMWNDLIRLAQARKATRP